MKVPVRLAVLIVAATMPASCGANSPTAPLGPPPQIFVTCPEFGESSRCSAFALLESGDSRDVTGMADWRTGDPSIASVSSTGLVTAYTTGEVVIRASYEGGTGFVAVWAIAGQGLHGIYRTLQGTVLSLSGALPGVVMEILKGPNAGRSMTTSSNGVFYMDGLQDGQFTIRLSKPGYVTAEYLWSIPGGRDRYTTLTAAN